jgi:hypothetical protein
MPNAYIPRAQVHEWSEHIGNHQDEHETALNRLLKEQRRLSRFVEENQASMNPGASGVALYLVGVVVRMFDIAGGRLKKATWAQVREASDRVGAVAGDLLPRDEGFADRLRAIEWRAQPHILDEALMALFERPKDLEEDELQVADDEAVKIFFVMWVVTEVLDACWKPPGSFAGDSEYSYVHIEVDAPESADAE